MRVLQTVLWWFGFVGFGAAALIIRDRQLADQFFAESRIDPMHLFVLSCGAMIVAMGWRMKMHTFNGAVTARDQYWEPE